MTNAGTEGRRVLFVRLDSESGYPESAQELVEGNWNEADPDTYYDVPDDLYFGSDGDGGYVWTDENGFSATASGVPGQPPSAAEAEAIGNAFLEHLCREEAENAELDGVVFVYDASEQEEVED